MEDKNKQNQAGVNRNVNLDNTRVYYSDDISMTINKFGAVFDFGQRLANTNQVQIVNRVGMSREFVKEFYKLLNNLLSLTEGQIQTSKEKKGN